MALISTTQLELSHGTPNVDPKLMAFLLANFATIKAIFDSAGLSSGAWVPPISATGLPSGAVWNNAGTLTIVP